MMIEFDGSISKKNQLDRMKKVNKEEIRICFDFYLDCCNCDWIAFKDFTRFMGENDSLFIYLLGDNIFISENSQKSSLAISTFSAYNYYRKRPFLRIVEQWRKGMAKKKFVQSKKNFRLW